MAEVLDRSGGEGGVMASCSKSVAPSRLSGLIARLLLISH